MTDHIAIIERAVTAYVSTLNSQPEDERNALVAMEAALTASGLLNVLDASLGALATIVAMRSVIEKSQQSRIKPSLVFGSDAMWKVAMADYDASETSLRNAIKGVKDD
ncbi:MAG: hypothetical protein MJH10_10470 [Epibacterium sp.]|nr:hypothetical protein [Epibacterium sp.]NQX73964.1 hypothetical protein [Epibacterium sp.]